MREKIIEGVGALAVLAAVTAVVAVGYEGGCSGLADLLHHLARSLHF